MKVCIFDLETFNLHADTGIILCCSYHKYGTEEKVRTIRADQFPEWKTNRSNSRPICERIIEEFKDFDIFIAHNGMKFDRPMLNSFALKYGLPMLIRFAKFIDPVEHSRRHLRLSRNSLHNLAGFLGIEQKKTDIDWECWRKAAYEGNKESMNYIVEHCEVDVMVLEAVHEKVRRMVKEVNDRGSSF